VIISEGYAIELLLTGCKRGELFFTTSVCTRFTYKPLRIYNQPITLHV